MTGAWRVVFAQTDDRPGHASYWGFSVHRVDGGLDTREVVGSADDMGTAAEMAWEALLRLEKGGLRPPK